MDVEVLRPEGLWLLLAMGPLWWWYRRSLVDASRRQRRISLGVRALMILLIVLAWSGLTGGVPTGRQMVIFLVDGSASLAPDAGERAASHIAAAQASMRPGDRFGVMRFAEQVTAPEWGGWTNAVPAGWADRGTDVGLAVRAGLANVSPDYGRRLVLFSDGHATTGAPLRDLAAAAAGGVPVDVVPLPASTDAEVLVDRVRAPAQVRNGEPFDLTVTVRSSADTEAELAVHANGIESHRETVTLRAGANTVRFRQIAGDERVSRYRVTVRADADRLVDNNTGTALVRTEGKPRALLIDPRPQDGRYLRWALEEEDVELEVRSVRGIPRSLAALRNVDLLIFSDVPAHDVTEDQMAAIQSYIRDFGGGFLMVGGDQSFGLGGYYRTVLEDVLPLRTDFEREREEPALGVVLVIDKSGSMAGEKLALAQEAATAAAELLDARDQLGVIAFDSRPTWVCELRSAADRTFFADRIRRLQSGGGTDMWPALRDAQAALDRTLVGIKHVIVLTDGRSTPGDFHGLISAMRSSGITVSTVAVGDTADRDLLSRIAAWGDGRYYFTVDPRSIPQIFAKETMTAARSALREEPFLALPVMAHRVLDGLDLEEAPFLLGYVKTRVKPTGELILATESGDPLLALWRYGLGQVGAFTSDAKNRWAAEWVEWSGFSRFWAQVVRTLARAPEIEAGLDVRLSVRDQELVVHVETPLEAVSGSAEDRLSPRATLVGPDLQPLDLALHRVGPGRFGGRVDAAERGDYHVQVTRQSGGQVVGRASGAVAVPYPEELRIEPVDEERLRAWAVAGGGRYAPDARVVFGEDRLSGHRVVPLWPWMLGAAILLMPLDVALRRVVWRRWEDDGLPREVAR